MRNANKQPQTPIFYSSLKRVHCTIYTMYAVHVLVCKIHVDKVIFHVDNVIINFVTLWCANFWSKNILCSETDLSWNGCYILYKTIILKLLYLIKHHSDWNRKNRTKTHICFNEWSIVAKNLITKDKKLRQFYQPVLSVYDAYFDTFNLPISHYF